MILPVHTSALVIAGELLFRDSGNLQSTSPAYVIEIVIVGLAQIALRISKMIELFSVSSWIWVD